MSLLPAKYSFTIWRGATFRKRIYLHEGDETTPLRDLDGHTGQLVIRDPQTSASLLELTTENGGIIIDPDGTVEIFISDEMTSGIVWTGGVYDLLITSPEGDADPLLWGSIKVRGV